MKYKLLIVGLFFMLWQMSFAQEDIKTSENTTRARQNAGYTFPLAYELPPQSSITPLAMTSDSEWVQIQSMQGKAWIPFWTIDSPLPPDLPTVPPVIAPALPAENCLSLAGDSVASGTVVYVVPGQGFGVLQTTPLSRILRQSLREAGLGHISVLDHSASAAFLSNEGKFPYQDMSEYLDLIGFNCRFTLIMPWVNDMSIPRADNSERHIEDLAELIQTLETHNPDGKILLLGTYYGEPSDFAAQHAGGYTTPNITERNDLLFAACEEDERFERVLCWSIAELFGDTSHVVLGATRSELEATLYEPIPDNVRPLFEVFWRDNPDGIVFGDGVHLNEEGKKRLSEAIVNYLLALEPDL